MSDVTPSSRNKFCYYSTFPHSLELDQPILFSHYSKSLVTPMITAALCTSMALLQQSHSFPKFPCDKMAALLEVAQKAESLHGLIHTDSFPMFKNYLTLFFC